MTTKKHVLLVGWTQAPPIGPEEVRKVGGTKEELQAKFITAIQKAKDRGYELHVSQTQPEDFAKFILETRERLQSRTWDAFIVGFGIRGVAEYTDAFEKLVNAARELAPQTRLGFNTRPDDTVETIDRVFNNRP